MSSTAFRPVIYMICVNLVKSAFPARFVRAYGMKRSRDRHHLSTAWVPAIVAHVKHVNEITYVKKLSMLKMLRKSRTGYSVQHMWNKFNIVSMLGYSETGYSVQKKCEIS